MQQPNHSQEKNQKDRLYFGQALWGARNWQAEYREELVLGHLPQLRDESDLADWLGIPLSRLRWFTYDRLEDLVWHYKRHTIPKRSGGERVILAPKPELKALQRVVLFGILGRIPASSAAHGFVPGRSIVTNAREHAQKPIIIKLDVKDFFPSITYDRVRDLFVDLGYSFSVSSTLALLCTERDRDRIVLPGGGSHYVSRSERYLVQGAPTSPALANLVATQLDLNLAGLAHANGFDYTRYADDLTFSGYSRSAIGFIIKTARQFASKNGFRLNESKTRIIRSSRRQMVTGLVVNDKVGVPRSLRRSLRAILHNAEQSSIEAQNIEGHPDFSAKLRGLIAFVHLANPAQAEPLYESFERAKWPQTWIPGEYVKHPLFGFGLIQAVAERQTDVAVTVSFQAYGTKVLLAKAARLRRIDGTHLSVATGVVEVDLAFMTDEEDIPF